MCACPAAVFGVFVGVPACKQVGILILTRKEVCAGDRGRGIGAPVRACSDHLGGAILVIDLYHPDRFTAERGDVAEHDAHGVLAVLQIRQDVVGVVEYPHVGNRLFGGEDEFPYLLTIHSRFDKGGAADIGARPVDLTEVLVKSERGFHNLRPAADPLAVELCGRGLKRFDLAHAAFVVLFIPDVDLPEIHCFGLEVLRADAGLVGRFNPAAVPGGVPCRVLDDDVVRLLFHAALGCLQLPT